MWINTKEQTPEYEGVYKCFGTLYKGTEHETKTTITARWLGDDYGWGDQDGEDLTGINKSITHWFDFSKVPDPIPSENVTA